MAHHNLLLNRLSPGVLAQIEPHLKVVELPQSHVLAETHQRLERIYFPHSGIISCMVELSGGDAIEIGMNGVFRAAEALDYKESPNYVVIQVAGTLSTIGSARFRDMTDRWSSVTISSFSPKCSRQRAAMRFRHSSPNLQMAAANA